MQKNKSKTRDRIHAARYVPGRKFEEKLMNALNDLPDVRAINKRNEIVKIAAMAAALILFLAFAAPPIVRAAGPLIDRLFGRMAEKQEAYLGMSEEEQFEKELSEYQMYQQGHDLDVSVEVGGATVSLTIVRCFPGFPYDDASPKGEVSIGVVSSKRPSFYAIRMDGKEYKLLGENPESTAYIMGALEDYPSFAVDNWKIESPTEVILMGAIGKDKFEIPFTFDPERALEEARRAVMESKEASIEIVEERADRLNALEKIAIPVEIGSEVDGLAFWVSEIALAEDDTLNVSWAVKGVKIKDQRMALWSCSIDEIYVDGYLLPWAGGSDGTVDGETVLKRIYRPLGRNVNNLPETSMVVIRMSHDEIIAQVAFKVNWSEKRVTLPRDDEEERQWLEESDALNKAIYASVPNEIVLDLKPLYLTREEKGISMMLDSFTLWADGRSEISFALSYDETHQKANNRITEDWPAVPELTIDGLIAENDGSIYYGEPELQTGSYFILPCHISEIEEGMTVKFIYTAAIWENGEKIDTAKLEFEFPINGIK